MKGLRSGLLFLLCMAATLATHAATPLDRAKALLNPGGATVWIPSLQFDTAEGVVPGTLVVNEPLGLEAFRQALEADPNLRTSADPNVLRLRNLARAWDVAMLHEDYHKVLRNVGAYALVFARQNAITANEALRVLLSSNAQGYATVLAISESGYSPAALSSFASAFGLRGGCWNCNYHDECFWGTCCSPGGSGCCVEIPCPQEVVSQLSGFQRLLD